MDKVLLIKAILSESIKKDDIEFIAEVCDNHNPIDILTNDLSDDILKKVGSWEYSKMIDKVYSLLYAEGLDDYIKKIILELKQHYFKTSLIHESAYDKSELSNDLCSTKEVLLVINLFYKGE